ncbi:MAG: Smr/MutS family protein [Myxococcales bacterium]|nr:Smr/MutS family protein [Myxococcales bacterium]USN51268.1 MAG: Smr/MutS family protein [Myxococcales bacterium]
MKIFALVICTLLSSCSGAKNNEFQTLQIQCLQEFEQKTYASKAKTELEGLSKDSWIKRCVDRALAMLSASKNNNAAEAVDNLNNSQLLSKNYFFHQDEELDLHGKRVTSAQELITDFFKNAVKKGKKYVLVITGKGNHSKEVEYLSDGSPVGKIKYNFLRWVQEKLWSDYVENISYAHGIHGGEGAFYVELKP